MNKQRILWWWSLLAGAMDAVTGVLLVWVPGRVAAMLGIGGLVPQALGFLSWVGVFVLAVGLSYTLALTGRRGWGEAVWMFTALVRVLVAVFLTTKIVTGAMDAAWLTVAVCDAVVAVGQLLVLKSGWWREVRG